MITGGDGGQLFTDFDVLLVGGHHEAGVGEVGDLVRNGVNDGWHGVSNGGHGDARTEVEQAVAVNVLEDGARGALDVDGEALGQPVAYRGLTSVVKGLRLGAG